MKTSRFLISAAAMATGLAMSSGVMAQSTASGSLNAKIVITANCAIVGTNTDLNFASAASTATNSNATGGFSVNCTNLTPYKIGLQSQNNGTATDGTGLMKSADSAVTQSIAYTLYKDAAFGTAWGNSPTTSPNVVTGTGTGAAVAIPVYAKTTGSLNVPASTYTDIVDITVYY